MIRHARKAVMSARTVSHGRSLTGIRFMRPRISEGMQDGRNGERFRCHERAIRGANDEAAGCREGILFCAYDMPASKVSFPFPSVRHNMSIAREVHGMDGKKHVMKELSEDEKMAEEYAREIRNMWVSELVWTLKYLAFFVAGMLIIYTMSLV